MTWFEFKSKVDEYLAENSIDPQEVEIGYMHPPRIEEDGILEIEVSNNELKCYPTYEVTCALSFHSASLPD